MNKSIMTVADNTPNRKVLELAEMLIVNRNRKFRCEFIKKDIITVCEMVDVGDERPLLRPRSINLATVVKMELA
jgi:hypothetical protein